MFLLLCIFITLTFTLAMWLEEREYNPKRFYNLCISLFPKRVVPPPYIPDLKSPTDTRHFEDILEKPVSKECFPTSKGFSGNHLPFVGFTFARAAKWATLIARMFSHLFVQKKK